MFSLPQTLVERPEAAAALESEYLQAAESTQAEQGRRLRRSGVEVEVLQQGLHAFEKPQPPPSVLLKLHREPSKKTKAPVADKLAALVALALLLPFPPYASYDGGGPGTPLSASLLISNEIL